MSQRKEWQDQICILERLETGLVAGQCSVRQRPEVWVRLTVRRRQESGGALQLQPREQLEINTLQGKREKKAQSKARF